MKLLMIKNNTSVYSTRKYYFIVDDTRVIRTCIITGKVDIFPSSVKLSQVI